MPTKHVRSHFHVLSRVDLWEGFVWIPPLTESSRRLIHAIPCPFLYQLRWGASGCGPGLGCQLSWLFHHLALLQCQFCLILICPSRNWLTVKEPNTKSTQPKSATRCPTLYQYLSVVKIYFQYIYETSENTVLPQFFVGFPTKHGSVKSHPTDNH